MIALFFVLLQLASVKSTVPSSVPLDSCERGSISVVESMPLGLVIQPTNRSIYDAWMSLIASARESIEIAAMYTSLLDGELYPQEGGQHGVNILKALLDARSRGVSIKLVETAPAFYPDSDDTRQLVAAGAQVGFIDWPKLTGAGGVLHTKFMLIDRTHLYVGSANYDWRSLTQVKELGVIITDCVPTATDLGKVFDIYWSLVGATKLPPSFPSQLDTMYNLENPMKLKFLGQNGNLIDTDLFFASSPLAFNTPKRTNDIDAIVNGLNTAEKFVCMSVMDYSPVTIFTKPPKFWPVLDNAIRDASVRGVDVKLLFSFWNHTSPSTIPWMRSLSVLKNVTLKIMKIPDQPGVPVVPFTRVNHSKYMITDKLAYITTSNWTPDYFLHTGGVSITLSAEEYRQAVGEVFQRDWNSPYTGPIPPA